MANFTENFFSKHKSWLNRNREYLENSRWHEREIITLVEEGKSVYGANKNQKKWQEEDLKADRAVIKNIESRLKHFIKNTPGEKHLKRNKYIVKYMVDIIQIFTFKCNVYPEENLITNIKNKKVKTLEIKFQDSVFSEKISVEDNLESLGVFNEYEDVKVEFYKKDQASLVLREPLILLNEDVKLITNNIDIQWESNVIKSNEMYINMKKEDIPYWNPKKHYFEQEKSTLEFWTEEYNKIKYGIRVGGYFIHPFLCCSNNAPLELLIFLAASTFSFKNFSFFSQSVKCI